MRRMKPSDAVVGAGAEVHDIYLRGKKNHGAA
jgi:hypothetical protein